MFQLGLGSSSKSRSLQENRLLEPRPYQWSTLQCPSTILGGRSRGEDVRVHFNASKEH
jgi:hypothetical protein